MKKLVSIVLVLALCAALFAACGGNAGNAGNGGNGGNGAAGNGIVGTWAGQEAGMDVTYTFKADGTFTASYASGTYTISGDKITLTCSMEGQEFNLFDNVSYSVNGNTLTIDDYTYTRQ